MRILREETGQGVPEYGLIIAFVVVMVVVATILFEDSVINVIEGIREYLDTAIL